MAVCMEGQKKDMIYVEMSGRMGNQMFRYAFARMLQNMSPDKNEKLVFDFSRIYQEKKKEEMPGWEDSLQYLNTVPYTYYTKPGRVLMNETSLEEKAVLMLIKAGDLAAKRKGTYARIAWRKGFLGWMNRHGIYQMFTGYDYSYVWVEGRKLLAAPFECARFPEAVREELLVEFTPRSPLLEQNRGLMDKIRSTNSVCVSIRRGNYLLYPGLDVCHADYFERAARRMQKLTADPVFFFFFDDVEWARENLTFPGEVFFESGEDPVWEKLRLMYSCRHFIISNSTFSWWAQFLGTAPDKKVIAPARWYNDPYEPPLYESGWIREEV